MIFFQAKTTVKKHTYEPEWNEQITFSELVRILHYSILFAFDIWIESIPWSVKICKNLQNIGLVLVVYV